MSGTATNTKTVSASGSSFIDAIIGDRAWSGQVTYAFPTSSSVYGYAGEPGQGFGTVSEKVKQAALFAMEQSYGSTANDGFSIEGFTNLNLSQASDPSTATVRLAESTYNNPTAKAYFPGGARQAGDVWFGTKYAGTSNDMRNPVAGNYAWHTLLHELGHALGLEHPGEGLATMPTAYNSLEYTVMTYRSYVGDTSGYYRYENYGAPQTYMMADIAALQQIYGADFTTNSGNTTYKWNPTSGETLVNGAVAIAPGANRIFATVWDGGGIDTYDLSSYRSSVAVDLRPGSHSLFSETQLSYLGGGPNDGFARGNIFNAQLYKDDTRSLIENAKGGSASDTITGNQAKNKLYGNGGNDKLYGREGNDTLYGGSGADTLDGASGNDFLFGGSGADRLVGGSGSDTASYSGASKGVTASLANAKINTNDAKGDTYSSIENLTGTSYDDRLIGNNGANRIVGGAGNDILTGGAGNDDFVFRKGFGKDTITDFTDGADQIDLRTYGFSSVESVLSKASQIGADTEIRFSSTDTLLLKRFDADNLDKGDFILV